MHLFVYGTLKRNFCRHDWLANETFLSEARTIPAYRLLHLGEYPGLVDDPAQGRSIQGEVWDVRPATLAILDEVEGVSEGEYARRAIHLLDHQSDPVEAYFYLGNVLGRPDCGHGWNFH